jgi:hypothetical protein
MACLPLQQPTSLLLANGAWLRAGPQQALLLLLLSLARPRGIQPHLQQPAATRQAAGSPLIRVLMVRPAWLSKHRPLPVCLCQRLVVTASQGTQQQPHHMICGIMQSSVSCHAERRHQYG